MPIAKIPIFGSSSVDNENYSLSDSVSLYENLYIQKNGSNLELKTRPGFLSKYPTLSTAYYTTPWFVYFPKFGEAFFTSVDVSNGYTYLGYLGVNGAATIVGTDAASRGDNAMGRPVLFSYSGNEYIVAGLKSQYIFYYKTGSFNVLDTGVGGNSYTKCCVLDNYLIKHSEGDYNVYFSAPGDLTSWSALDFISTGQLIQSIHSFNGYLYLSDGNVTKRYYNDGSTPFVSASGQDINIGTLSINSICDDGNDLYLISSDGRFGKINGNTFQQLGKNISGEIEKFFSSYISRIKIFNFKYRGKNFISIINQLDITGTVRYQLIYDIDLDIFYKWTINLNNGSFYAPAFESFAFHGSRNYYVAGIGTYLQNGGYSSVGILGDYGQDTYNYTGSAVEAKPINQILQTGLIDHGTHRQKRSRCIRLRCRKTTSSGTLRIAYRDNAEGSFVTMRDFDIDSDNNNLITIENFANGIYRQRQYKITSEGAIGKLGITDFEEEFEILGS